MQPPTADASLPNLATDCTHPYNTGLALNYKMEYISLTFTIKMPIAGVDQNVRRNVQNAQCSKQVDNWL